MAYNNTNNGRQRQSNKFVPEGGGGWNRQYQSESSKYYANLSGHQKQILAQLSEMFGQSLDREIILTLAASCEWNVNVAIESLIELSQENGYSAPAPERRRSFEPRTPTKQRPAATVPVSPQSATKIAYQGYDDTDDADVIVEEEEEFEIVKQPPVDHKSRLQEQAAQQKTAKLRQQSPIYRSIQAAITSGDRLLVLMRGMPGSGKTYAARQVLANAGIDGVDLIFSTDDFFCQGGRFQFTPGDLPEAHDWNRARVATVMKQGLSPVIVDNTNTQAWEMKPYLQLAVTHGYIIELLEPSTPWCWREAELAQRNMHGVPRQTIRKMIERYERWMVGPLLTTFNMRYSPNNIPPQRCSNPTKKSANVPTLLLRKQQNLAKPSNVTAKPSNLAAKPSSVPMKPSNAPVKTTNGNNVPVKKNSVPATTVLDQVGRIDLTSSTRALPQRVKKSDNVNTATPSNVLQGDTKLSDWEALINNLTSSPRVNPSDDAFEFPPTPPEWIPLTWETIPELQSIESSLIVKAKTLEVSSTSLPLEVSPRVSLQSQVSEEVPVEQLIEFESFVTDIILSSNDVKNEEVKREEEKENLLEDVNDDILELKVVEILSEDSELLPRKPEKVVEVKEEALLEAVDMTEVNPVAEEKTDERAEKIEIEAPLGEENILIQPAVEEKTDDNVEKILEIETPLDKDKILIQSVEDPQPTDIANELEPAGDMISIEVEEKSDSCDFSLVHEVPVHNKKTEELLPATDQVLSTLSHEESASVAQATKSIDIAVPNMSEPEAEAEAKRSPKINLFAWLFPKKSKTVPNVKTESSPPEFTPWQPYEPRDISIASVTSIEAAINVQAKSTEEVKGEEVKGEEVKGEEVKGEEVKGEEVKEEEENDSATFEPMSLLLDAAESEVVREVVTVIDNCEHTVTNGDKNEDINITITKVIDVAIEDTQAVELKDTDSGHEIFLDAVDVTPVSLDKSADSLQVDAVDVAREPLEVAGEPMAESSSLDDIPELSLGTQGSWAKLNPSYVLADEISNSAAVSPMKATQDAATPKCDAETITSHADFSLLTQELQTELRVLSSRGRSINTGASAQPPRPRANVHTLDRGTMTSPVEEEPCDEDFELLVKMFPKIPCEDLTEVFERCKKEINWTVELLMESGYAFEPSPDLEVRFEDSAQLLKTQELLEELNSRDSSFIQPLAADPFLGAASVLGVGDSNTKSRHFGLFGSSESLEEAGTKPVQVALPEPRPEAAKSSPTKKAPKKQSQLTLQLKKQMEERFVLNPDCYSEETLRIKRIRHGEGSVPKSSVETADEPSRLKPSLTLPSMSSTSPKLDDCLEADDDDDRDTIPLTLDADFLRHLRRLFGEPMMPCNEEVAVVDLPVALARQIHGYLADSQLRQLEMQEQYFQNMIQDEEFARRLQAEELPPPDLRQIMDMEIALELYRADSAPRQTEEDLATRLSKQKLAELFPAVDRAMLFDVFEAHGRSFAETLAVLEASTGEEEEAARTVMSPQAMAAYEKLLIDKAKAESSKQTEVDSETDAATPKEQAMSDAKSYRDEANRLYTLRNECYQKASNAQRSGMQSVASYYAQVGHLYKQRIELANSQAASALLSAHSVDNRSTTLDLHFLYVVEALEALDIFLDHHVASLSECGKTSESIFIITGSGLHSVGGKPRIKPAVQRRLAQRKLRYQDVNPGLLKVVINRNTQLSSNTK